MGLSGLLGADDIVRFRLIRRWDGHEEPRNGLYSTIEYDILNIYSINQLTFSKN